MSPMSVISPSNHRYGWLRMLFFLALIATPRPLLAHASLRKSLPGANARLAQMPNAIRLWFTEEPELSLTVVRLLDSAGVVIPVGAATHDVDGKFTVRISIDGALHPGVYTVKWRTVATDGHPSSGSFTFRVLEAPRGSSSAVGSPSEGRTISPAAPAPETTARAQTAERQTAPEPTVVTPLHVVVRFVSFVALLALIGATVFWYLVLPRANANLDAASRSRTSISNTLANGAAIAAAGYVLAAGARLWLQSRTIMGAAMMGPAHMRSMAMATHWGAIWRTQVVVGVVALGGALLARRYRSAGWFIVALASMTLALATALGGHAAAAESQRPLAVIDDTLHVLGAAGWLGSLLWVTFIALPVLHRANEDRARRVASLVEVFSPTALACGGIVAVTGLVSAWLRLGRIDTLWTSSYGQVLLVKLALLVGVGATGFYNWRYVQPSLGTDAATARLGRSARVELTVGLLVLVATAVLVAMPTPVSLE
jgi:copper transport protein